MRFRSRLLISDYQFVFGHQSGVTVMLKLEDETNNTIIVEAQDVIDVANARITM